MTNHRNIRKQQVGLLFLFLLLLAAVTLLAVWPEATFAAASSGKETASTALQPAGDMERGRQLFMGDVHFQNGGPTCMGCHNIGNNGLLGGGALGPDLTNVSRWYNDVDLTQALATIPWRTMKPIFAEHPLTAQEQADLRVFLEASSGQPRSEKEPFLYGLSLASALAALGLFGFLFRGRLRGVRRPLVERSRLAVQEKTEVRRNT